MKIKSRGIQDFGRCSLINFEKFKHLIFPSGCIYCGRATDSRIHGFCFDCYNSLSLYLRKTDFTWYVFEYDKRIASILKKAKYGKKPEAVKLMAGLLGDLLIKKELTFDMVIPVPMHRSSLSERGYNQSSVAAEKISKVTGIPFKDNVLRKIKKTKRQAELSKSARSTNLKGAFQADSGLVKGRSILVIDDIITTGSTLLECKNTLMNAGALHVKAAVIAHTPVNRKR